MGRFIGRHNNAAEKIQILWGGKDCWEDTTSNEASLNAMYNSERPILKIGPKKIKIIVKSFSETDQRLIDLYYYQNKIQPEIAEITGIKQPTVSLRLQRIRDRLKFLLDYETDLDYKYLSQHLTELECAITKYMIKHANYTKVAKLLNMSFSQIRHKWLKTIIPKLKKLRAGAFLITVEKTTYAITHSLLVHKCKY